jgi:NDP-sugar pyrophosphorylase family protein
MKAMIFAAGLGTRLRPLTDNKPKALVEVAGKPLILFALQRLAKAGFREIVVNVHHFSSLLTSFIHQNKPEGVTIYISDESGLLLDTGGGLKAASKYLAYGAPFLVYNVDILSNLDLEEIYRYHLKSNALATLAVRKRKTSRYFLFDRQLQLCGWRNVKTMETRWCNRPPGNSNDEFVEWAFSGIQVLEPEIFKLMPDEKVFSIIDVYLKVASTHLVLGYPHEDDIWIDAGTPQAINAAEELLLSGGLRI